MQNLEALMSPLIQKSRSQLIKSTENLSDIFTAQIASEVGISKPQAHVLFGMWCIYLASTLVRLFNENLHAVPDYFTHTYKGKLVPTYWLACHLVRCLDDYKSLSYVHEKAIRDGFGFENLNPNDDCLLTDEFILDLIKRVETYQGASCDEKLRSALIVRIKASMSAIFYKKGIRHFKRDLFKANFSNIAFPNVGTDNEINLIRASMLSDPDENNSYIRSHGLQQFGFMEYHPADLFAYRYSYVEYFVRYMQLLNRRSDGYNGRYFWHFKLIFKSILFNLRKKLKSKNNSDAIVFLTYWLPNGQYPWDSSSEMIAQRKLVCDSAREAHKLGRKVYLKLRQEELIDDDYLALIQEINAEIFTNADLVKFPDALYVIPNVSTAIIEYALAGFDFVLLAVESAGHWWLSPKGEKFFHQTGLNLSRLCSIQDFKHMLLNREERYSKIFKRIRRRLILYTFAPKFIVEICEKMTLKF